MAPLDMIAEWKNGCTVAGPNSVHGQAEPVQCQECTAGLIAALEEALIAEKLSLIWSNEHGAWWRPGHAGYTVHLDQAGRYEREEAERICAGARDGWRPGTPPPEIPVRLVDALAVEDACARKRGER